MTTYSYKGVEYEFVRTPNEFLEELKCPICLELVFDPVQTSCGHLFCGRCVEGIRQCPIEGEDCTETHQDNYNKRRLRGFKVKCTNSEQGCDWQGELGDVEGHTADTCKYQKVNCPRCGKGMLRRALPHHLLKYCRMRDDECPHCHHQDTSESIFTSHFTLCDEFPLTCPACGYNRIPRKEMATHLQQTCPMEFVECEYNILGCGELIKRNTIDKHIADDRYHRKMALEAQGKMYSCLQGAFTKPYMTTPDISNLPLPFRPWLRNTPTCYPRPPWVIKIGGFQEKKERGKWWYSDPVYSHFGGYKMCLELSVNAEGDRKEGTHVSVCICLMRGDNDDNLKWPFKGTIQVSLLNQLEDGQHHTMNPELGDELHDNSCWYVTRAERVYPGDQDRGFHKFLARQDLSHQDHENQQFLKDDTVYFRVDSFELKLD